MNQMNMVGFNAGNPALGTMPMANNVPNGVTGRAGTNGEENNLEAKLNSYIYSYFLNKGQWDIARTLKNSGIPFEPPILHTDGDVNGADDSMQTDSKDGIIDTKRPDDLPDIHKQDVQSGSFLLNWFGLFWDIYWAQQKQPSRTSTNAMTYVQQTQQHARMRSEHQNQMLRNMPGMAPGAFDYHNVMRFQNGNLQRKALENNRFQPSQAQLVAMRNSQMMRMPRDPSEMDMNGQRPRTPSAGDHAPSPSKRPRIDGVPFNMMPNGRGPPPGIPGQMLGGESAMNANHLLMNNGINPGNLSDSQFASFQQQNPAVQRKSIQVYAQNLAKTQRQQIMSNNGDMSDQGSPILPPGMDMGVGGPDFYASNNPTAIQMRGGVPANAQNGAAGNQHALQDYQMQLMILEQQNKKRLIMARQEQDPSGGRLDGAALAGGAFAPSMSPSGSRGGPSPGPSEQAKRGTPKIQQAGLPASPMPDGSMRGSPAAIPFNGMSQDMYNPMNGSMRPPSSHPFNGGQPFNPQQMEAMRAAQNGVRMNGGGNWQQGPQGPAPMIQAPQPQPPAQMGTPQQRNDMPPPQGVPTTAANGRQGSPAAPAPPTPQQTNKANPKGKKDPKERKRPAKKSSTASVVATPASEADLPSTPTPATPITPHHAASFAPSKGDGQGQTNIMQGMTSTAPDQLVPPQPDAAMSGFPTIEGVDDSYSMPFNSDLNNPDLLENFDFEQFLQTTDGDFNFDPSSFGDAEGIEAGMGGGP